MENDNKTDDNKTDTETAQPPTPTASGFRYGDARFADARPVKPLADARDQETK